MIDIFCQQIAEYQLHEKLFTPKFSSLSLVIVEQSHECICLSQENDLSASALSIESAIKAPVHWERTLD